MQRVIERPRLREKGEKNPQKIIKKKKNGLKVGVVFIFWAWVFLLYIIDLNKYNIV